MLPANELTKLQDGLILIVDDDLQNLKLLRRILDSAGCQVVEAASAVAARQKLQTSLPDVILLDVVMPERDGYALCVELKSSPQTKHIPVIFLSGLHEAVDKVKA